MTTATRMYTSRARSGRLTRYAATTIERVIEATLYTDAACPWGYSALPSFRVLEWRYGVQLDWRLVMIGLREDASAIQARFDAARSAIGYARFRHRYGMPFSASPKERAAGTGRGCRAVVAARMLEPGAEWRVLRALQLANFNSPLLLDDDELIRDALRRVPGVDADAIVDRLDDPEVTEAYEQDRAEARRAAGTAAEAQGKTSTSDGPVRFTAPSIVFERDGQRLVAGGWQPLLAYDVLVANLDPGIVRTPPPETPEPLLERFPDGLTTAEVAALLADGPDCWVDMDAAEAALLRLVGDGVASKELLGQDAIWKLAAPPATPSELDSAAAVA